MRTLPTRGTCDFFVFFTFFCRSSYVNDRTYTSTKKAALSGRGCKAFQLGYRCHFVKLLSVLIYVERVYARRLSVSNFAMDRGWIVSFLHFLQYFSRIDEVFGGRDLDPLVGKDGFERDAELL